MELEGIIKNIISFLTMLGGYHRYMITLLDRANERIERELNKKINLKEWENFLNKRLKAFNSSLETIAKQKDLLSAYEYYITNNPVV